MARHLAEATTRTALVEKALEAITSRQLLEDLPLVAEDPIAGHTDPLLPIINTGATES